MNLIYGVDGQDLQLCVLLGDMGRLSVCVCVLSVWGKGRECCVTLVVYRRNIDESNCSAQGQANEGRGKRTNKHTNSEKTN